MGKIVWLASYPKSGNTWLRFFLYAYFKLDPKKDQGIDLNDPALKAFSTQDVRSEWFRPFLDKPFEEATPADIAAVRRRAHEMIAKGSRGGVFVKTHNAFVMDHGVHNITPEVTAGAVYIVRNPRDVVVSAKDHFGHKTIDHAIQQLNSPNWRLTGTDRQASNLLGSWAQHVESWVGAPRRGIFPVRYEDMLEDPEKVFGWIIGLLGHEVDEERLRFALSLTSFDRMKAREAETGFGEKSRHSEAFFRRGVAGGWREALTIGEAKRIVEKNHEMMARFGYLDERLARFVPKTKKPGKSRAAPRR